MRKEQVRREIHRQTKKSPEPPEPPEPPELKKSPGFSNLSGAEAEAIATQPKKSQSPKPTKSLSSQNLKMSDIHHWNTGLTKSIDTGVLGHGPSRSLLELGAALGRLLGRPMWSWLALSWLFAGSSANPCGFECKTTLAQRNPV